MHSTRLRMLVAAALAGGIALVPIAGATAQGGGTWYVQAGAVGTGTASAPFGTLAATEAASGPGDTIVVLPGVQALDGGITLKQGQRLVGAGPDVRSLAAGTPAPVLTNTTKALAGDAVRLADDAEVSNLRIASPRRGAVYGVDVSGVRVTGLDVTGQNASCTNGFLIPAFNAPTNVPGVGLPIPGLQNGWAAIMVDASTRQGGTVWIDNNTIHDATCGDGIDLRLSGAAQYAARIDHNDVRRLGQGRTFLSLLAIGLQAAGTSRLEVQIDHNTQYELGNKLDLNLIQGADSEGVFINGVDRGRITATVDHNDYANVPGLGGFSANGLEAVTMGKGADLDVVVTDSTFTGSTGDVIEAGGLGTDANIRMRLERVLAEKSGPVGNTYLLPFNNGDCLLVGSLGARNDIALVVRDSVLRDCANNGISIGSNVVNGTGPTTSVSLDVDRSTVTGNRGANLGIRNFTALDRLRVKVARTDLRGSLGMGSGISALSVEDIGWTKDGVLDLGGGVLGSGGGNCIGGKLFAADVFRYDVSARFNWWGQAGGPKPGQVPVLFGSLRTSGALASAPACGAP